MITLFIFLCVCHSSQTDSQGDGSYPCHPCTQWLHPQTQPLDQDAKILLPCGHRVHRPSVQHQVRSSSRYFSMVLLLVAQHTHSDSDANSSWSAGWFACNISYEDRVNLPWAWYHLRALSEVVLSNIFAPGCNNLPCLIFWVPEVVYLTWCTHITHVRLTVESCFKKWENTAEVHFTRWWPPICQNRPETLQPPVLLSDCRLKYLNNQWMDCH